MFRRAFRTVFRVSVVVGAALLMVLSVQANDDTLLSGCTKSME